MHRRLLISSASIDILIALSQWKAVAVRGQWKTVAVRRQIIIVMIVEWNGDLCWVKG